MFIVRWLGIGFALISALFTSQLPEFSQQYRQRLGGALDELNRMLAEFDQDAFSNKMNRTQGIDKLTGDKDPFIRQRGQRIVETDVRAARLSRQREKFESAGPFNRILVMARDYDSTLAGSAWQDFQPAVPATLEGIVSAITGFFAGLGIWRLMGWPFNRRRHRLAVVKSRGSTA